MCAEMMPEVLPHVAVEVRHQLLAAGTEPQVLGPSEDGRLPDMFLDCMGATAGKELLMRFALEHRIPVISVFTSPNLCLADPSRVAVAKLAEVWASPAAAALRQRLAVGEADEDVFRDIDVVHSQEGGLWAMTSEGDAGIEHRLQLGVSAAAAAILRLTGGKVPQQADACGMNFWKKLRHSLERQEAGAKLPDLYWVGCVADYIWRGRSALSRATGVKHSDMALTRWDHRLPPDLSNLVLMTSQEAQEHHAQCKATASLPARVLEAVDKNEADPSVAIQRILSKLRAHLDASLVGGGRASASDSSEAPCQAPPREAAAPGRVEPASMLQMAPRAAPRPGFAGLVGETKLVELRCLSEATGCRILGKAEFLSPGGCQKDRVARQILDEAAAAARLRPGGTVVEGTSGSTGISLCLAAAARGYRVHVVLPDDQAAEKAELLRRFGATVQLAARLRMIFLCFLHMSSGISRKLRTKYRPQ